MSILQSPILYEDFVDVIVKLVQSDLWAFDETTLADSVLENSINVENQSAPNLESDDRNNKSKPSAGKSQIISQRISDWVAKYSTL